jgi:nitrous oxide reductase accessory protein NosL
MANIYFKDYNREEWIEAEKTYFVVGTEILGPMGIEFLPVDSREAAVALQQQEHGQEIVPFAEVDREYMIKAAKAGRLHLLAKELVLQ